MPSVVGLPRQRAQAGVRGIGGWSTFHRGLNEAGSSWAISRSQHGSTVTTMICSICTPALMSGRMADHVRTTDTPLGNRNAPAEEVVDLSAGACAMPAATSLTVQCQPAQINSGMLEPGGLWY